MTTAEAQGASPPFSAGEHRGRGFAAYHRWDRTAFLVLVGLIWLGILMGFVPDILKHLRTGQPFPLIVHLHAALFVGWLLLLTGQVLLIRVRRADIHRKLGMVGMGLVPLMVVAGVTAAIIVEKNNFGTALSRPPFLAIEFTDMLAFAGLAGAALVLRGDTSAHKRLILLATFYIADAGYSRWLGPSASHLLGRDFAGRFVGLYLGTDLLLLALGAYDLMTRKRLHPAYIAGGLWMLACQLGGVSLYRLPEWKPIALAIIGH